MPYDSTTGRVYVDKANNLGISAEDVARALGITSLDMGTQCTSDNINPWSRKKPVHINSRAPQRNVDWWKGSENDCGIRPPARVSTFAALKNLYDGNMNGWRYIKPTLHYRRVDFDGYCHYATPQITEFDVQPNVFSGNNIVGSIGIRPSNTDSLDMSDITVDGIGLDNWYIGIAIFNGSTLVGWQATEKGLTAQQYEYPTNNSMIGNTYTVVPFYSKVYLSKDSGNSIEGALMPIPQIFPKQVKVSSVSSLIAVTVDMPIWDSGRTTISFGVIVTSNNSSSFSFTSAVAKLRFLGNSFDDPMVAGEYEYNLGITSIGAGKEIVKNYSQYISSAYRNEDYIVYVKLIGGGNEFTAFEEVMADETEIM